MAQLRSWRVAKIGGLCRNMCIWGSAIVMIQGLVACSSRPIIYPVIVPVYSPAGGGQAAAPQSYSVPPSYPSQADYPGNGQQGAQIREGGIQGQAANSNRAVALPEGHPPYGQYGQPQIAPSLGQPVTATSQGMVSSRRPGMPSMSVDQRMEMFNALFHYSGGAVDTVAKELAEAMQPVLEASACGMAWVPEWAGMNNTEMAKSRAVAPFQNTPGHDGSTSCLNVRQVDNWRIAPPTRVTFRVLFESRSSHERASRRFEMMRGPTGQWYFQSMNEPF